MNGGDGGGGPAIVIFFLVEKKKCNCFVPKRVVIWHSCVAQKAVLCARWSVYAERTAPFNWFKSASSLALRMNSFYSGLFLFFNSIWRRREGGEGHGELELWKEKYHTVCQGDGKWPRQALQVIRGLALWSTSFGSYGWELCGCVPLAVRASPSWKRLRTVPSRESSFRWKEEWPL